MVEQQGHPFERGPYVQVAAFCERVLQEADGVISLIRIVDRITHTEQGASAPESMPEVRYPLTLVLVLKSGSARGRHEVTITPVLPSQETLPPVTVTVQMEGENRGVNITSRMDIPYKMEGLYWFNVTFDNMLFTRMPLEVRYARLVTGPTRQESP